MICGTTSVPTRVCCCHCSASTHGLTLFELRSTCSACYGTSTSHQRCVFTRQSRMLRASLPSSGRLSVCLFVRLSVTLVSCIKTVQAWITKSSLRAAPRSLVYRDKISCHWVQGSLSNEGVEEVTTEAELLWAFARLVSISSNFLHSLRRRIF